MHQFVSVAFLSTTFLFTGVASSPALIAQDLDDALRDDRVWAALTEEEQREIAPVLRRLLFDVMARPSLDPSEAYTAARDLLRRRIQELGPSKDNAFENQLWNSLSPYLSDARVVDESVENLKATLERFKGPDQQSVADGDRLRRYAKLSEAIELFIILAPHANATPADYENWLAGLKDALIDRVSAPGSNEFRKELGRLTGLLDAMGTALGVETTQDLVSDVRRLYQQPNLWLHTSEDLLNAFMKSAVPPTKKTDSVRDCILGTSIRGQATTCAQPSVLLCEAQAYAALKIQLNGVTTTNTVGYQKPVQIRSVGRSTFLAEKCLTISDRLFTAGRASASACTNTTICSIKKVGRQLLSNLIERIAWRRAGKQKPQAEAIASRKLEKRVEEEFDQKLAGGQKYYAERFRSLLTLLGVAEMKFRSTCDHLMVGATFAKADQLAAGPQPAPTNDPANDLTIQIHQSFLEKLSEGEVPPEALDRLLEELLSNLPGSAARIPEDAPRLFELIRETIQRAGEEGGALDASSVSAASFPNLPELEFHELGEEGRWVMFHWRLQD